MLETLKGRIYPSDPAGVYRLAADCAKIGVIGTLVALVFQQIVANGLRDDGGCSFQEIQDFNHTCLDAIFESRRSHMWSSQFSNILFILFGLMTCIPFFTMEDMFADHKGASFMRMCLICGLVLECMKSAFTSGLRSAAGQTSAIFRPNHEKRINPYVGMQMAFLILDSCFTWVTFLRDTILAVGIYIACVYDADNGCIGGTWRTIGYSAAAVGIITTVCEFLKVINYRTFDDLSNWTYVVFFILYNAWIYYFGMHCVQLGDAEEKGMLESDASASDVSEGEVAISKPEIKQKKSHNKHREAESDDDV